jgi:hypothetical protein
MIALVWILSFLAFTFLVFFSQKTKFSNLILAFHQSFSNLGSGESWIRIGYFVLILFFPLIVGMNFYLKTDANVIVVLVSFVWIYQWIKIVWNSREFDSSQVP